MVHDEGPLVQGACLKQCNSGCFPLTNQQGSCRYIHTWVTWAYVIAYCTNTYSMTYMMHMSTCPWCFACWACIASFLDWQSCQSCFYLGSQEKMIKSLWTGILWAFSPIKQLFSPGVKMCSGGWYDSKYVLILFCRWNPHVSDSSTDLLVKLPFFQLDHVKESC